MHTSASEAFELWRQLTQMHVKAELAGSGLFSRRDMTTPRYVTKGQIGRIVSFCVSFWCPPRVDWGHPIVTMTLLKSNVTPGPISKSSATFISSLDLRLTRMVKLFKWACSRIDSALKWEPEDDTREKGEKTPVIKRIETVTDKEFANSTQLEETENKNRNRGNELTLEHEGYPLSMPISRVQRNHKLLKPPVYFSCLQ